ncbi:cyclic nucleotide-binding domain-containing protein [Sulfuritalea hydrogenivorans]|uniref:Crp/Fnr family transcriptional regulator n=1 Tax=Sulfuritalea hydrogenivorans sk43H TaxID=1223802 RepID=W0SAI3_9PROT|nr:cyclic nucleotide-binding domain-containing protein [Sulfuritalea hydrogenivorans]MDK9713767.1 cyclic nucleotide-binding domain-containing protein [Sulfuritalea sp.]BAO27867.1 Crp/Fnr family transcriptional regulator [Sulfuritalea hydrogenivorans sk43H]
MMDIADTLDGLDLFKDFAYPELKLIARYLSREARKQGEVIFSEGDPGTYMLILVDGRLSIFKGGESGNHLLSHEGRGRMVGEMALLDHERRSASCMADTDCTVLILSADEMARMAAENPLLAYRFMFRLARLLSRRLRKTSGMLVEYLVT